MPQARKKQTQKTAAKKKACGTKKKTCTRACCKQQVNEKEKYHVYIVTAMSMIVAILLCTDVAMMMAY